MNQHLLLLIFMVISSACQSQSSQPKATHNHLSDHTLDDMMFIANEEEVHQIDAKDKACQGLFGNPSELTGLTTAQCNISCQCNDRIWTPAPITTSMLEQWDQYIQDNASNPLNDDPYQIDQMTNIPDDSVCALVANQQKHYQTQTFPNKQAAYEANAYITHGGVCGLCSSLQDLMIYATYPDLTQPVRECGIIGLQAGQQAHEVQIECLVELGFSSACASIWSYNITNTRTQCLSDCVSLLNASYHESSGDLNACIQCDEDLSGPVFKYWAGRTRRNSGLPTALCRPCNTVFQVDHHYPLD